jgi:hypothetical protein
VLADTSFSSTCSHSDSFALLRAGALGEEMPVDDTYDSKDVKVSADAKEVIEYTHTHIHTNTHTHT